MSLLRYKFFRFSLSSFLANSLGFLIYVILVKLGVKPLIAFAVTYWSSVIYLYFSNKIFVFCHNGNFLKSFIFFIVIYVAGFLLSSSIIHFSIFYFKLNYLLAITLATILMAAYFFLMQNHFVFSRNEKDSL